MSPRTFVLNLRYLDSRAGNSTETPLVNGSIRGRSHRS